MTDNLQVTSIFQAHPSYGKYISHHPSNRLALVIQGGTAYTLAIALLQLLFWNVPDAIAGVFLPMFFAGIAAAILWYLLHLWNREVVLYEKGFTYREGSRVGQFRYEEIVRVRQNIERVLFFGVIPRTIYDYRMSSQHDEQLRVNNVYSQIDKLVNRLDAFIARDRQASIKADLAQGKSIPFGEGFEMSQQGLVHQGQSLAWQDFKAYQVKGGKLLLHSHTGSWAQLPVPEIDNVVLLLSLLKARLPQSTERATSEA